MKNNKRRSKNQGKKFNVGFLNFPRIVTTTILATLQNFVIIKPSGPEQSTVYVFQALIVIKCLNHFQLFLEAWRKFVQFCTKLKVKLI